ncbi:MAG: hypothetical protein M3Y85_12890, partial [Bacteroidota bacterium]|nr:hypothetical protein [Bacteroidota bacterium]
MKKNLLFLFLLSTVTAFSQKVSNKINFQKGQKLEVTSNINMNVESLMGETTGNIVSSDQYLVSDAGSNSATFQKETKHIKLAFSLMGKDYKIDSDNKDDMNGKFGEPIKKMMNTKYEFTVDEKGKILAVKGDDKKKKNDDEGNG